MNSLKTFPYEDGASGFLLNNDDTVQLLLKSVLGLFVFGISCCTVSYIENPVCTLPVKQAQHCTVNKVKLECRHTKIKILFTSEKKGSVFSSRPREVKPTPEALFL